PGRRLRDPRRPPRPGPAPLPRGRPPRGRDPLADRLGSAPRPPARAGTHLGPAGTPFDGASEPAPPDVASPPPREASRRPTRPSAPVAEAARCFRRAAG